MTATYTIVIKAWMGAFGLHPESILTAGSVRTCTRKTAGGNTYIGVNPATAIKKLEQAAAKHNIPVGELEFKWEVAQA